MICVKFPAFCDLRAHLRIRLALLLQTCVWLASTCESGWIRTSISDPNYPWSRCLWFSLFWPWHLNLRRFRGSLLSKINALYSMPYIPFLTSKAASSQKTFQFLFVKLRSWGTSVFKPHLFLTDAGPKFDKFERKRKRETWNSLQMLNETLSGFGKTNRQFIACARSWLYGGRGSGATWCYLTCLTRILPVIRRRKACTFVVELSRHIGG